MAVNNLLDTSTVSFSDVIGSGKLYHVPPFQRDYTWKLDHWEDLWADIVAVVEGASVHYMGSIVLQNRGNKRYTIIDGQQRLATLSLIALATIGNIQELINRGIEPESNTKRIELLRSKFLGERDPGSLTYSAKLELNENNNSFYQLHLMTFREPYSEKTLGDSNKLLLQAYKFFFDRIKKYHDDNGDGQALANFLNQYVAEKLMFIQIVVEDELSAYTVFETLNSRGVGLTVTDLLKNYLFSLATSVDLPHVREKWKRTVDTVGLDAFPTFLRHYWMSRNSVIRQEYLFRAIKDKVTTSSQVIELLDELEYTAQLYNALTDYTDSFWIGKREQKRRIKELQLFNERQALPLLIAAHQSFGEVDFAKILKVVSVLTFRHTVIGKLQTSLKEEVYSKAAARISNGELTDVREVAQVLRSLYPSDTDFKNDFSTASISTKRKKKLVRYILFELENQLSGTDADYEDNPATIEHILPENTLELWSADFPPLVQEHFVYRLGNYTLLEDEKNKACGTRDFVEKKEIYHTSQYVLSQQIRAAVWTPDTIESRQMQLADIATSVWRIPYYDAGS